MRDTDTGAGCSRCESSPAGASRDARGTHRSVAIVKRFLSGCPPRLPPPPNIGVDGVDGRACASAPPQLHCTRIHSRRPITRMLAQQQEHTVVSPGGPGAAGAAATTAGLDRRAPQDQPSTHSHKCHPRPADRRSGASIRGFSGAEAAQADRVPVVVIAQPPVRAARRRRRDKVDGYAIRRSARRNRVAAPPSGPDSRRTAPGE